MEQSVFEKAQRACENMSTCLEILNHAKNKAEYMTITFGTTAYAVDDTLRDFIAKYYQEQYNLNAEIFKNL